MTTPAQTATGNNTPSLTGVTANRLLTLTVAYQQFGGGSPASPTLADSSGQTWNTDIVRTPVGALNAWACAAIYSLPAALAGTHNLTLTLANAFFYTVLNEWPLIGAALDQTGFSEGTTAATNTITATTGGSTIQSNEVELAVFCLKNSGGSSNVGLTDPPTGFTSQFAQQSVVSGIPANEHAYNSSNSPGAQSVTWAWTSSSANFGYQGVIAAYTLASVGTLLAMSNNQGGF